MIIYEITAAMRADLIEDYEKYMRERHIPDLLETGYFSGAALTRSAQGCYRIQYLAPDRAALDGYLANDAGRLRADFLAHFPEGAEVSREVWDVLQEWGKDSRIKTDSEDFSG